MALRPGTRREAPGESADLGGPPRQAPSGPVALELGHCWASQQMDHESGHHEGFFSPTTATYVELLSAAGLVASAARGEHEQRRTLNTFDNAYASHSKLNATQYKRQKASRSSSHRTNLTPELAIGHPLKQTYLEVITGTNTTRDLTGHGFLESPETPRAPVTPDALTTSSATYFDSVPIHMSRSSSFPNASQLSTSDPFEPSNVVSQSRSFTNHAHPPAILKLAKRLARSSSQTSQLSNQELEAVENQFSWLEDAMSEDDEDPFALDRQFTPKQLGPSRALPSTVDPDNTPRLPTTRTPLFSSQSTPRHNSTQRANQSLSFNQHHPPHSARLQSPGPPPDLPLPSIPPPLPLHATTPRPPSRTRSSSKSVVKMPPVPPLPVGLGLGLPTKALTGSRSPRHAPRERAVTENNIFRNRSHTSGVDRLPSQTKEDMTFLIEEHHKIQASRARAVSGGSGMSRGLMHNQRAEFRKKTATIPALTHDTDTERRESDVTSISSATGSEVELLPGEQDEILKGRKGKTRIW